MQQMKRFARFWDIVYNSGNFVNSTKLMFHEGLVFETFFEFSQFIYSKTDSTFQISLDRMSELIFNYLVFEKNFDKSEVATALIDDILKIAGRVLPKFLREYHEDSDKKDKIKLIGATKRQAKRVG